MRAIKFIIGLLILSGILISGAIAFYLKGLPYIASHPKALHKVEKLASDILDAKLSIKNPYLKTEWSSDIYFSADNVSLDKGTKNLLNVKNIDTKISLKHILKKQIILNKITTDYAYANISEILALPPFKDTKKDKDGIAFDIFQAKAFIKNSDFFYQIDKENSVKINAKNLTISDNPDKKYLSYDITAKLIRDNHFLNIRAKETGENTIFENKEKLIIKNSNVKVEDTNILFNGDIDIKNYNLNFKGKKFSIPSTIDILNSQIVANNISDYLAYFKDIDGNYDFDVDIKNEKINGKVKLNALAFKLIPLENLPILLNKGDISFDNSKVKLKNFKGYYNNKIANSMDFDGTIDDYLKTVDTNLVGNAVVTNDFAKNYLSKLLSYPMQIQGKADTRVILKSKNNKIDLLWLYKFEKGNGFIVDGEETFMNNTGVRVLASKIHFENMLMALKSINYYIEPRNGDKRDRTPILSMNGNIDFSGGKQTVKDLGITLTKPMPSGFLNMLLKQNLFRKGTFTGNMRVIYTPQTPLLEGALQANEVGIPSQRLFIKQGEFSAKDGLMHIKSNGYYRRSTYDVDATVENHVKLPIVVRDANLTVDNVDVEKYLQAFNNQQVGETSQQDINTAISQSVNKEISENDETTQTFDLANLRVEKATVKIKKGFYKNIHFADVIGTMNLNKDSILTLNSNRFDVAEGKAEAKINCDLKNHKYNMILALIKVNADLIASELFNLPQEIKGKANGIIDINTDKTLKLNGTIKFVINNGVIAKIGLVEYAMKIAALFRNPIVMVTPSVVSDLVDVPEGKFDRINGTLTLERNVIRKMVIKSVSPQLSTYIVGRYNLDNQDAILRVYTMFSNRRKGAYGFLRSLSLNTLANRIPLSSRNASNYYASEIAELPKIEANEKDTQIFLTKVDGDIVQNNFISSLHKIK